jgi:hypothetical protein
MNNCMHIAYTESWTQNHSSTTLNLHNWSEKNIHYCKDVEQKQPVRFPSVHNHLIWWCQLPVKECVNSFKYSSLLFSWQEKNNKKTGGDDLTSKNLSMWDGKLPPPVIPAWKSIEQKSIPTQYNKIVTLQEWIKNHVHFLELKAHRKRPNYHLVDTQCCVYFFVYQVLCQQMYGKQNQSHYSSNNRLKGRKYCWWLLLCLS